MRKGLDDSILSALLTAKLLSLLGWSYFLCTAHFGGCPRALTSPGSWGPQHNPGSTVSVSCNGFSRPPVRNFPAECLPTEALLNHEGRFHNAFSCVYPSCLWKQNDVGNTAMTLGILAQSLELLNHIARSFDNYYRSRKFPKPVLSSGWKHSLRAPLTPTHSPCIPCWISSSLISFSTSVDIRFSGFLCHFAHTFCFSLCPVCSFAYIRLKSDYWQVKFIQHFSI